MQKNLSIAARYLGCAQACRLLLSVAVQLPECNEASNQGTGAAEMRVMTYRRRAQVPVAIIGTHDRVRKLTIS